ncbi:hypothetical protein LSTR_LSTR003555 [Laodelphax striatellus]|uniref:Uncharacterized protein n=1 Tax=Laodelphax striatellus TaxID=195883 RepID=A0A482WKT6_LAOST|nr:hypothetical protein LSTR_LSTR003555 [Laodelphax striatellus]
MHFSITFLMGASTWIWMLLVLPSVEIEYAQGQNGTRHYWSLIKTGKKDEKENISYPASTFVQEMGNWSLYKNLNCDSENADRRDPKKMGRKKHRKDRDRFSMLEAERRSPRTPAGPGKNSCISPREMTAQRSHKKQSRL